MAYAPAMPRHFVIDTDCASDDAVALMLALRDPEIVVDAITVVAGNVPLDLAVRNTLITLDVCDAPALPVHAGLAAPIVRPLETAQFVHGEDGMGGADLADPTRSIEASHAVDALRVLADDPTPRTLVTLGPLSNIAAAVLIEPDLLTKFEHTFLMAGSPDGVGNVNVAGEYNVWADPEAAAIVFAAPGAKTMVGWNISRLFAVVHPGDSEALAEAGPLGRFVNDINVDVDTFCREVSGLDGYDLPDPITMAIAIDEDIITRADDRHVAIACEGLARGAVLLDNRHEAQPPNCRVVWEADEAAFKQRLLDTCAGRIAPA